MLWIAFLGPRRLIPGAALGPHQGELVVAEVRPESPHFGQWFAATLDDVLHKQIYIPPGYAHGFCVLSELADFEYRCTGYYDPDVEKVFNTITLQLGPDTMLATKIKLRPGISIETAIATINNLEARLKDQVPGLKWSFVEPDIED